MEGGQANADAARLVHGRDVRLAMRDGEDALTALNSERLRLASLCEALPTARKLWNIQPIRKTDHGSEHKKSYGQ